MESSNPHNIQVGDTLYCISLEPFTPKITAVTVTLILARSRLHDEVSENQIRVECASFVEYLWLKDLGSIGKGTKQYSYIKCSREDAEVRLHFLEKLAQRISEKSPVMDHSLASLCCLLSIPALDAVMGDLGI